MSLTAKYFSGSATPEEALQLHESLSDPEIRTEFDRLKQLWYQSSSNNVYSKTPVDEAWQQFSSMIGKDKRPGMFKVYRRYIMAACIGTVILCTGLLFFLPGKKIKIIEQHTANLITTDTLPDGTVAVLNVNTLISYPGVFNEKERPVILNGEAFFNVTPDRKRPFIISVDNIKIKVVGTSFNVRKLKNKFLEVQVASGVVQMYKQEHSITMRKGQTGIYNYLTDSLVLRETIDVNSFGYASKKFVFNDIPFSTACQYLEKSFNVTINIENELFNEYRISSSFENESLDYILEVLCNTLNTTYTKKQDTIFIKSNNNN